MSSYYNRAILNLRYFAVAVATTLLASAAFGSPKAHRATQPTVSQLAANVGVAGHGTYIMVPDTKTPGRTLLKIWASSFVGAPYGVGFGGVLNSVTANLFQHGEAVARLTAPAVKGNNLQNMLVASGRVTIISLIQPGTVLTADKVTWFPKKDEVIAVGNVFYKDGKYGATIWTGEVHANTSLKRISASGPMNSDIP